MMIILNEQMIRYIEHETEKWYPYCEVQYMNHCKALYHFLGFILTEYRCGTTTKSSQTFIFESW